MFSFWCFMVLDSQICYNPMMKSLVFTVWNACITVLATKTSSFIFKISIMLTLCTFVFTHSMLFQKSVFITWFDGRIRYVNHFETDAKTRAHCFLYISYSMHTCYCMLFVHCLHTVHCMKNNHRNYLIWCVNLHIVF